MHKPNVCNESLLHKTCFLQVGRLQRGLFCTIHHPETLLQSVGAKICWKECASDTSVLQVPLTGSQLESKRNKIYFLAFLLQPNMKLSLFRQNVNIEGCRRRASYPHRQTINITFLKEILHLLSYFDIHNVQ